MKAAPIGIHRTIVVLKTVKCTRVSFLKIALFWKGVIQYLFWTDVN